MGCSSSTVVRYQPLKQSSELRGQSMSQMLKTLGDSHSCFELPLVTCLCDACRRGDDDAGDVQDILPAERQPKFGLQVRSNFRVSVKHVEITTYKVLQPSLLLMLLAHPVVLVLDLLNFQAI